MYWDVALLSPPYSTLTYSLSEYFPAAFWQSGQRVGVYVGKKLQPGVLLEQRVETGSLATVRPLFWPLESRPLLNPVFLKLVRDLASRHLRSPGQVLAHILPKEIRSLNQVFCPRGSKTNSGHILLELPELPSEKLQELARLWVQDQLLVQEQTKAQERGSWVLNLDPPWPLRPRARRQRQVLDFLWHMGRASSSTLRRELGSAASCVRDLQKKGMVVWQTEGADNQEKPLLMEQEKGPRPSAEQSQAISWLFQALDSWDCSLKLLYGVTGSGKTLVYTHILNRCLQQGRSALVLAPEVALAWQLYRQLQDAFPECKVHLYHGYQSPGSRAETFRSLARQDKPCLVVGTRSAVFLPRQDWGLLILDEEHDSSFKQEERFTYQAKEVAYFWAKHCGAVLLLGSATPDVKTFYAAQQGELDLLNLQSRVGNSCLPEIELVDLSQKQGMEGPFAVSAHQALQECLQRGEQAIILLNTRGYAPLIYCISCSKVIMCEHCEVGLTYHKKMQRLVCHYCGLSKPFPLPCPQCGGHQFLPIREGTEQVEEYLASRLDPDTPVLRLDRDSTRRKGSMERILEDFAAQKAQVLVGTQMCSKGHHFPEVTLVLVLDGDVGLNLPDYRATERTFQLLLQVSGRAGRGDKPGRVLIQTRNPEHYCWQYVQASDYQGFYQAELKKRERLSYPPFSKLALLRFSYPAQWEPGEQKVQEIGNLLRSRGQAYQVQVLGPAPAPLSRVRDRLRKQCLLKAASWAAIRGLAREALNQAGSSSRLRISLDLDPMQML
ncbi:MAG: replication restart helicase PriA [Desulfohalobiaceae bacterium]